MIKYKIWTDEKVGKWLVLDKNEKRGSDRFWLCRCECGFEKYQSTSTLTNKLSLECKSCSNISKTKKEEFKYCFYTRIKEGAEKRNIEFNVSQEYLWELFLLQNRKCVLTNMDIGFANTIKNHTHSGSTASLDRIDSNKGYVIGNVQWVHKDINKMKMDFEQVYFKELCNKVTNYEKAKSARISGEEYSI